MQSVPVKSVLRACPIRQGWYQFLRLLMLRVRWLVMWKMTHPRLALRVPAAGCTGDWCRYGRRTGTRGPVILGGMEQDPSDPVDASDVSTMN